MPFWPGGFDDAVIEIATPGSDNKDFRTVAPGLPRGLRLPGDPIEDEELVAIDGADTEIFDEIHQDAVRKSTYVCKLRLRFYRMEQLEAI